MGLFQWFRCSTCSSNQLKYEDVDLTTLRAQQQQWADQPDAVVSDKDDTTLTDVGLVVATIHYG